MNECDPPRCRGDLQAVDNIAGNRRGSNSAEGNYGGAGCTSRYDRGHGELLDTTVRPEELVECLLWDVWSLERDAQHWKREAIHILYSMYQCLRVITS